MARPPLVQNRRRTLRFRRHLEPATPRGNDCHRVERVASACLVQGEPKLGGLRPLTNTKFSNTGSRRVCRCTYSQRCHIRRLVRRQSRRRMREEMAQDTGKHMAVRQGATRSRCAPVTGHAAARSRATPARASVTYFDDLSTARTRRPCTCGAARRGRPPRNAPAGPARESHLDRAAPRLAR
jgi:hypothetical protein